MAVTPRKASTIILLREIESGPIEVFLLKRHEKSGFMGGSFVYPGGRVDPEDAQRDLWAYCKGISPQEAHRILRESLPPSESIAHWVSGIRELFEEAGVLLAYDPSGHPLSLRTPTERDRFLKYRESLQKGRIGLLQMAQKEKILFALDQLHYYAHWITPEARPERFDTRFFLAIHPAGQEATYDEQETTTGVWLTPWRALEENRKGTMALSPPTLKTLEDLSRFQSLLEIFDSVGTATIEPILPVLTKVESETLILFPSDPEYGLFQRGAIPEKIDHGRISEPGDASTRLILREGRWLPHCRLK